MIGVLLRIPSHPHIFWPAFFTEYSVSFQVDKYEYGNMDKYGWQVMKENSLSGAIEEDGLSARQKDGPFKVATKIMTTKTKKTITIKAKRTMQSKNMNGTFLP